MQRCCAGRRSGEPSARADSAERDASLLSATAQAGTAGNY